jgi:hypothetical protein
MQDRHLLCYLSPFCLILSLADMGIVLRVELAPDRPYAAAFFMRSHLGSFCQFFGSCNRHGIVPGGQGRGAERILREPGWGNNRVLWKRPGRRS